MISYNFKFELKKKRKKEDAPIVIIKLTLILKTILPYKNYYIFLRLLKFVKNNIFIYTFLK